MPGQVIEAPNFGAVRQEAGYATEDALKLLWYMITAEGSARRATQIPLKDTEFLKVLTLDLSSTQNNLVADGYGIIYFIGTGSFNLTGIANGVDGRRIHMHNQGTGTITIQNLNAGSDVTSQFRTSTNADKALTSHTSSIFFYAGSRWREFKGL